MHTRALIIALAMLAAAAGAQGQSADTVFVPLVPGTRVRIAAPELGAERITAVFSAHRGDTLVLMRYQGSRGDSLVVATADVQTMEVSRGWRARALRLGIAGAVVGAIAGGIWGYNAVLPADDPSCSFICRREPTRVGVANGVSIGISVGGVVGALVGRFVLGEQWTPVTLGGSR